MSAAPTTATPPAASGGIDIQQALEILSQRSASTDAHSHATPSSTQAVCGCHRNVHDEARSWGQVIDMGENDDKKSVDEMEVNNEKMQMERAKRRVEIEQALQTLSVSELVACVISSQHERVTTYRSYDRGLEGVLQTGNLSDYPVVCAEVTASFSVLSETINTAQAVLATKHDRSDISGMIARLQSGEKQKLNLTAALHLERIRAQAQSSMDKDLVSSDTRISSLLQEGVKSLQQKIATTIEGINEALDELSLELNDIAS